MDSKSKEARLLFEKLTPENQRVLLATARDFQDKEARNQPERDLADDKKQDV